MIQEARRIFLMKIFDLIRRLDEFISSFLMAFITLLVGIQVFSRYILNFSLAWSEELTLYLFVWIVYIGCSYAMREEGHFSVYMIRSMLGQKNKNILIGITYIITIIFCIVCVIYGIKTEEIMVDTQQKSPAMQINMYWPYLAIPIGMGLMAMQTIKHLWQLLKGE
jgi:TRAP-type C4-dicarboxylate transport system permease small subunit